MPIINRKNLSDCIRVIYIGIRKFIQFQLTVNLVALFMSILWRYCHKISAFECDRSNKLYTS